MKRPLLASLFAICACLPARPAAEPAPPYLNPQASIDARVEDLLGRMTLEEKIGQMCQFVGPEMLRVTARRSGTTPFDDDASAIYPSLRPSQIDQMVRDGKIGSFLHVLNAKEANTLQRLAQESRLKIPLLIGIDAIHGNGLVRGATIYPAPIGLASTFDPALVEKLAQQTAREVRASGSHWTFSPNVDVIRDPRWGRVGETFGEDPFLIGQLGSAMVRGYQGSPALGPDRVLACIKHLIGGGQPLNGINVAPADISEHTLRSIFLPPFVDGVKAGAGSLMVAHNELNGVPCHANAWLVEDVMRREAGFHGFVVSDWMDIERLVDVHHTAADQKEAVYQTVTAGMDMHMHGPAFLEPLLALVQEGRISEQRIDVSARRILRAKFHLGLFERPLVDATGALSATVTAGHRELALDAARKSIVLLKNQDGLLPLVSARFKRILVTGPLADTPALLGDWVLAQPADNVITPLEGLRRIAPAGCEIVAYDCGTKARAVTPEAIAEAARQAREADAVIVVVGENALRYDNKDKTDGENMDRSDLELPGNQNDLVRAIVAAGKPVVVVLVNGRPIGSEWLAQQIPGLIEAWQPGGQGGQAIAEVIFGVVNPSGRLPITVPRGAGHLQDFYNHKPSHYYRKYTLSQTGPLFPFGHGLSYTTFAYSDLRVPATLAPGQDATVTLDVTNTGPRAGDEIVLVYVNDVVSSVTTPARALKTFTRVTLQPGQTQTVQLSIPYEQLALFNAAMKRVVEPGDFDVFVGQLQARFTVVR